MPSVDPCRCLCSFFHILGLVLGVLHFQLTKHPTNIQLDLIWIAQVGNEKRLMDTFYRETLVMAVCRQTRRISNAQSVLTLKFSSFSLPRSAPW
ncbi:hypothetical protein BDR04DRAFT_711314 [Suillus decipiens]|nr:hypothetical protein BDR04DRAFT_711314 [Suillus decipiens]